jgi:aminobenzoyl-glutamate transport protein
MFIIFFVSGLIYGLKAKTIKGDKDVAQMTAESMGTMGGYIVLAFVAAHLVQFFIWSNLGSILAISGRSALENIGFVGIPLLVAFILVSSFINLIIGSASAKWAILAPVFVPMLMLMGYSPETTMAAYRIGDSYSNILTPSAILPAGDRFCAEVLQEHRDRNHHIRDAALRHCLYDREDTHVRCLVAC